MLPWKRVRRTLTAALLPAAVFATLTPLTMGSAAASPAVQPKAATSGGWNDYSCKPSAAHPRPVVLVHGTFANSVDNWLALAPYLVDRGYCVYSLDYGQMPGVTGINGIGPVSKSAEQLAAFVDKVLASTGAAKADVVGHSQGGMMPRYYLRFLGGAAKVNALVGIAPSNHGTTTEGLSGLLTSFPGAKDWLNAQTPGVADQLVGSAFLAKLNAGGDTVPGVHYTVLATRYDEVVTPYQSQFLNGPDVHNIVLQDLCAADLSGHVTVGTVDFVGFHEVANALDPAHATPTTCFSATG
jgi:triacylglycerol esterase/lipase EstA (alpha/beta hydrolase family)